MMEIDENGRILCRLQAKIFEESIETSEDSSAVFVRRFMRSDLARRMDIKTFLYEAQSPIKSVKEVDEAFNGKPYGSEKYSVDEMYWMGYFYRAFCLITGKRSKTAYSIIGARELRGLYLPYHSLSIEKAVQRVLEAKDILDEDMITRGVAILRKLRLESQNL